MIWSESLPAADCSEAVSPPGHGGVSPRTWSVINGWGWVGGETAQVSAVDHQPVCPNSHRSKHLSQIQPPHHLCRTGHINTAPSQLGCDVMELGGRYHLTVLNLCRNYIQVAKMVIWWWLSFKTVSV